MSQAKTGKDEKPAREAKGQKEAREGRPQKEARAPREGRQQPAAKEAAPKDAPREARPSRPAPVPRLQIHYRDTVVRQLMDQFGYKTSMQVPRIEKIVLNMGVGEAVADKKAMDGAVSDLTALTGQKPLVTKSRKAIASFKLRAGVPVGAKVTLRGARMYEFLDRLINVAMPRIRDFRGVSARSFDGRGNYSFGVKEQIIFPEIAYDKIDAIRGMDITITTTARDDREGRALLESFNFPFRK
jgi:large subunit ribosomal protein L5